MHAKVTIKTKNSKKMKQKNVFSKKIKLNDLWFTIFLFFYRYYRMYIIQIYVYNNYY